MPTKVQSRLTTQAGLPTTLHFTGATTAGNCLVLQTALWGGGFSVSAVSDAVNGAWSELGGKAVLGSAVVQVWYKLNAASIGSGNNLTITANGGDSTTRLSEWSGVATAAALDPSTYGSTTGNGTSATTSIPTGSITTGASGDLYLSWAAEDGNGTITWSAATSPWTLADHTGDTTYIAAAAHDRTDGPATGTYSDTLAYSGGTGNGAAKIVALKAAGGGTTGDKDAGQRFSLRATAWRDAPARFRLLAPAWHDAANRFGLRASGSRDVAGRVRSQAAAARALAVRLLLQARAGRDASSRLRLLASSGREPAGRFRLLALALRDGGTRALLAARGYRDAAGRVRSAAAAPRDIAGRLVLHTTAADTTGVLLASPAGTHVLASPARRWVLAGEALARTLRSAAE